MTYKSLNNLWPILCHFLEEKKKKAFREIAGSYVKGRLEKVGMSDMEIGQESCKSTTVVMKD
jgi:hypothetical protein